MKIELNQNKEQLEQDIHILEKAIKAVISSAEFRSLFGKTQFLDADEIKGNKLTNVNKRKTEWTDRRTRGDHSINVAAMASHFIEKIYMDTFGYEQKALERKEYGFKTKNVSKKFPITKVNTDESSEDYILYCLNKKRAMLLATLSGYSHDLGHTPFGHDGEDAISDVYEEYQKGKDEEERRTALLERREIFGEKYEENLGHSRGFSGISSFEHIEQSYINFLNIINKNNIFFPDELLESTKFAILAHSRSRVRQLPTHISNEDLLVVHAIRTADKGDYQIVDGAEMENLLKVRGTSSVYSDKSKSLYEKIQYFIDEWVRDVKSAEQISDEMYSVYKLKQYRSIYEMWAILYCEINQSDLDKIGNYLSIEEMMADPQRIPVGTVGIFKGNKARNKCVVKKLMKYYLNNYDKLPEENFQDDTEEAGYIKTEGKTYKSFNKKWWEQIGYSKEFIVIGFITSLTNADAKLLYEKLVRERIELGKGNGIEPITNEEIQEISRQYTLEYIQSVYKGLTGDKLSNDEKKELEQKLRQVLINNKEIINKSLTDRGYLITGKAKSVRISEYSKDAALCAEMKQADEKRARYSRSELKYPNTSGGDENPGRD